MTDLLQPRIWPPSRAGRREFVMIRAAAHRRVREGTQEDYGRLSSLHEGPMASCGRAVPT